MEISPIRNEADWRRALAEIERLMNAGPDTPEGDRLDVLVTLVEAYEKRTHPMPPADPVDAILFRLDQTGMTPTDLEPLIGPAERVAAILRRERPLTLPMIRRLSERLGIPADILVRPYDRPSRAA